MWVVCVTVGGWLVDGSGAAAAADEKAQQPTPINMLIHPNTQFQDEDDDYAYHHRRGGDKQQQQGAQQPPPPLLLPVAFIGRLFRFSQLRLPDPRVVMGGAYSVYCRLVGLCVDVWMDGVVHAIIHKGSAKLTFILPTRHPQRLPTPRRGYGAPPRNPSATSSSRCCAACPLCPRT